MFYIDNYFKKFVKTHGKKVLTIEPAVVDHCNLNCAYCDHYSPIASKGFYDIEQFEKDFEKLSVLLNSDFIQSKYCVKISLVGGEPFLHPQLLDFVKIVFKYMPLKNIYDFVIITNGTLFKQRQDISEELLEIKKKYKYPNIVISSYPIVDIEKVKKNFFDFMKSEDTRNLYIEDREFFNKVNLNFDKRDLSGYCSNNTMCLRNGKLFKCPVVGNIQFLLKKMGYDKEVLEPEDYLYLHGNKAITPEELDDFHMKPRNFCYYCKPRTNSVPWKKSEFDIKEWIECK